MTRRSSSVTIRDVAREAGVSVATISRYINQTARVSDDVAQRIEQAITSLHYVPHAAARHLATKKTRVIGLLLTNMHNDFFAPLVSGIESVVREQGFNLLVATHRADMPAMAPFSVGAHNTDGLIVFADSLSDQHLADLRRDGFPLILTHRSSPPDLHIPSVTVENKDASRRLVEHLIQVHNRRRIMFARGPAHQDDSHWREVGYREALAANGLEYDPELVICGEFEREIAYTAMMDFLAGNHPPFDAVFSGDDDAAIGIIKALKERGYRVPEDVSVVGFDDSRLSAFLTPPLTTVRAPTEEVGRTAAQRLFDVLSGKNVAPVTLLPTEIVIRHSCGCHTN